MPGLRVSIAGTPGRRKPPRGTTAYRRLLPWLAGAVLLGVHSGWSVWSSGALRHERNGEVRARLDEFLDHTKSNHHNSTTTTTTKHHPYHQHHPYHNQSMSWPPIITNDPNEPFPTVILPYPGEVDPFYNISSDGTNLWDEDPKLPEWVKAYLNWHKWRRQSWDPEHWADDRWLLMQCLKHMDKRKCGGTSDRLKTLPTLLRIAYEHHRMLLIRWTRPATLESFLVPPVGGVDWRVPGWLAAVMDNETIGRRFTPNKVILKYAATNLTVMRTRYQSSNAGSNYYDERVPPSDPRFEEIFAGIWRLFFTPAPPVADAIHAQLDRMSLVPGHYTAAHLRALYGIDERPRGQLELWARNAIKCASNLRPGSPVFFASDSGVAAGMAREYGELQRCRVETHEPNPNPPLHLDADDKGHRKRKPKDFYDTFVDLYLISLAGCVTYNTGGYGHWGLLIGGDTTCRLRQETRPGGRIEEECVFRHGGAPPAPPPRAGAGALFLPPMD